MLRYIYRKYWDIGFKSRLYDFLTPQAYLDSLTRAVRSVAETHGGTWLDAGCGSGLSIPLLENKLKSGARYLGTDLTISGLSRTLAKAEDLGMNNRVYCFQSDLTTKLPLRESSVDIILAHFSTYTISNPDKRKQALKNLYHTLKTNGALAIVNPSREYDARNIIRESLERVKSRQGPFVYLLKKCVVYPLTLWFGLRFIERQLKTETWKAYSLEEFCEEVRQAGFKVIRTETVYANSAYLVVGEKAK